MLLRKSLQSFAMHNIVKTGDGSPTLYHEGISEHYHSKHGALQESRHVFIEAGLKHVYQQNNPISILEVGFGTGLNFLLSLEHAIHSNLNLSYIGIEPFPLDIKILQEIGFHNYVQDTVWNSYNSCYHGALKEPQLILKSCKLFISTSLFQDFEVEEKFDLIYYDAFSVQHQPEMWTDKLIAKAVHVLKPKGVFVSYAITGQLKRALKAAGCSIEKLPGAKGKREMIRATKII